jgi:hypothetical protein
MVYAEIEVYDVPLRIINRPLVTKVNYIKVESLIKRF